MALAANKKSNRGGPRPNSGRPKGTAKASIRFLAVPVPNPDSMESIRAYLRYCRARARTEYLRKIPNHDEIARWLKEAAIHAKDLLKFEHPALANTVLQGDREQPVRHTVTVEIVGRKDENAKQVSSPSSSPTVAPGTV